VLFDASASTDPDGSALEYVWDLGDGTTRTGEKLRHAYARPGIYKVRLSVRDETGLACGQSVSGLTVSVQGHDEAVAERDGNGTARR
jgi:PKD repeat protein